MFYFWLFVASLRMTAAFVRAVAKEIRARCKGKEAACWAASFLMLG
jgi:hypothetical protein